MQNEKNITYLLIDNFSYYKESNNYFKDINPGTGGSVTSTPIIGDKYIVWNGKLYFSANDGVHGTELWVTDGTTAGTTMLKDINPGASGSGPGRFAIGNGQLFLQP